MEIQGSDAKLRALRARLRQLPSALVAFSGGADSAFLLKIAVAELGDRVLALTAVSASLPTRELEGAAQLARSLGARHEVVQSQELADPGYVRNSGDRCYYCKRELYALCAAKKDELGLAAILDGFNADDRRDHRPGQQAARERGVISPLAEAELTKEEIRAHSRTLGLSTWDKPQSPCLSSRIPYGMQVTLERLRSVGDAEEALHALGFTQVRVRHHGEVARIELPAADLERLLDPTLRARVDAALKACGFGFVAVDLEPFRSGRMNDVLVTADSSPAREG
jgi:pyridinium-3,5-biscarboxylic acid mononucleotide sulfurtransferase